MINSIIHQPCEISLHLYSSDIFIHPPRPNTDIPGDDKTLRGIVEIRNPSDKRTIQGVKVVLQSNQNLAIPEKHSNENLNNSTFIRHEEKILSEKIVEITSDGKKDSKGKGKAIEDIEGIVLEKGIHGFEFAFIIPANSPPIERCKNGRVKYTLTATALGAGRGKSNVSTSKDIFVILQVNADGGPVPLDIQYHDVHEALGALSVSLTSANLTVGGVATLSIYHPSPPIGLSVHVVRVFLEQTIELYSETRKQWMKLPLEKLRLWERGFMPHRDASRQIDPNVTLEDSLWLRSEDGKSIGRPARAVIGGGFGVPTLAPYGTTLHPGFNQSPSHSRPVTPGSSGMAGLSLNGEPTDGYKLKAVLRLPDDNHIRPSTVRGSRAEIRISHEMGIEIFFSRSTVLDSRQNSETFGKPKVQVFSMRRSTIIPSCLATYDSIHLPPYSLESPMSTRPNSRANSRPTSRPASPSRKNNVQNELDHWKLTQTLKAAFGQQQQHQQPPQAQQQQQQQYNQGSGSKAIAIHAIKPSQSQPTSRSTSPTRSGGSNGNSGALGYFAPSSHHHGGRNPSNNTTGGSSSVPMHSPGGGFIHAPIAIRRSGASSLHALTPREKPSPTVTRPESSNGITNSYPTIITAPASGQTTPLRSTIPLPQTLPPNSPWAVSEFPNKSATSHENCQCGQSTEELIEAEQRLLEGVPTAPGAWIDAHDEGQLPPPWTPSRPSSPILGNVGEDVSGWYRGNDGIREGGRSRGKIGDFNSSAASGLTSENLSSGATPDHDSDDDGGRM